MEIAPRDVQPVLVAPQALFDQLEPLLRAPGLILRDLDLPPDRADLGDHGALMRLLGPDLRRRVGSRHGRSDSRRECGEGERAEEDETVTSHRNGVAKEDPKRRTLA